MYQKTLSKTSEDLPPRLIMLRMIMGHLISQSIYIVAKLGIADFLKDGEKNCEELAISTGTDPRSLYRVMRALSSIGVFVENELGNFVLTPLATCLQSDNSESLRALAILFNEEDYYRVCGNLMYSVETGKNAFEYVHGKNIFQYYTQNPERGKIFNEAMTVSLEIEKTEIINSYNFSEIQTIVDIGGGQGGLISSILKYYPNMQGILYEQPYVVEGVKELLEAEGVSERCKLVSGDFFESVPVGGDAYILKNILHNWDDEQAILILKNCHQAMKKNEILLVIEIVIQSKNEQFEGKIADLSMLLLLPGAERTEAEYQALFERSGFKLTKIVSTKSVVSVIEGIRI